MRKQKEDILLALVAAHEQLLWVKDLLRWEEAAANEEVECGATKALEALKSALGTAALDMAVGEASKGGYYNLCEEMLRRMSCDHCPFNSGDRKCWIAGIEQQDKEGWKRTRKKWMEAKK